MKRICLLPIMYFILGVAIAQNVGIGTTSPVNRLDIRGQNNWDLQNTEGDVRIGDPLYRLKIGVALGGGGKGAVNIMQYGQTGGYNALSLGSQGNNLLSMFGSTKIVEIANITGGIVGIGITPSITDGILEIGGRARIQSNLGVSAGVWLNNSNNSAQSAFIGMEDDNHVGFFGNNGAGWRFTMNTQTGALKVNGNEGSNSQLLTSTGPGTGSQWQSLGNLINTYFIYNPVNSTAWVELITNNEYELPNSTFTFSTSVPSRLIISASYLISNICPSIGSCDGRGDFYFKLDNVYVPTSRIVIHNVGDGSTTGTLANYMCDVNPGSHLLTFYGKKNGAGSVNFFVWMTQGTVVALPQ